MRPLCKDMSDETQPVAIEARETIGGLPETAHRRLRRAVRWPCYALVVLLAWVVVVTVN